MKQIYYITKQIYGIRLKEGSLRSLHWQSAPGLLAQQVPLCPARWLRFFFGGILEAAAGSASQSPWNQQGEGLLNGGFLTLTIWGPRR